MFDISMYTIKHIISDSVLVHICDDIEGKLCTEV